MYKTNYRFNLDIVMDQLRSLDLPWVTGNCYALSTKELIFLRRGLWGKLQKFERYINSYMNLFGPVFCRLNTRSPKDNLIPFPSNGHDWIIALSGSQRIQEDIDEWMNLIDETITLSLVVRPLLKIDQEYRVFVKNRSIVEVKTIEGSHPIEPLLSEIKDKSMPILRYMTGDDYVIDWIKSQNQLMLLELNQLDEFTDDYSINFLI